MNISARGLALIESFEGFSSTAYWDPYGHVWTVGYGETEGVGPSTTMSRAQASADLQRRVEREYEPAILALGVPLDQNQFDALCSFVWNVGPGSMSWDVGRDLRARDYQAAADALLQYDRSGGVVLAGLTRRRQAERALFLTPYVPPTPPDPHHYREFPLGPFDWNGRELWERATVLDYDRLRQHPFIHRPRLAVLRVQLGELADRVAFEVIDQAKTSGRPRDWSADYRGWRYQQLTARAQGKRLA